MSAVIWVHWDALSVAHPVFGTAPDGARRVHVWDSEEIARRDWSLKRCVFVLECLAEMKVEILEGKPAEVLDGLGADALYMADTPDPYLRKTVDAMKTGVTKVSEQTFTTLAEGADMGRFFRYWNKAKRSALRMTRDTP
ncbi:MAG: hypothetical protein AAF311_08860 [Pseudomonadota bacterium]